MEVPSYRLFKEKVSEIEQNNTATQAALELKADVSDLDRHINQMMMKIDSDDLEAFKDNTTLIYVPPIDATGCTTLAYLFSGCGMLRKVPFIRTTDVTDMTSMFNKCTKLTSIPEMDTSSVTDMMYMFNKCTKLTSIPEMDTSSVTSMDYMFYECSSLTTIPLLNISSVTSMSYMFDGCSSLTSVTFQCDDVRKYRSDIFNDTPIKSGNGSIYVPDNLVDAYKTASGWSELASVIHGISEKPN